MFTMYRNIKFSKFVCCVFYLSVLFTIVILLFWKLNLCQDGNMLFQLVYQSDRVPFDENCIEIIDGKNIRFCWKDFENKTNCAVYKLEEYNQAIEYLKSRKRPIHINNIMWAIDFIKFRPKNYDDPKPRKFK